MAITFLLAGAISIALSILDQATKRWTTNRGPIFLRRTPRDVNKGTVVAIALGVVFILVGLVTL